MSRSTCINKIDRAPHRIYFYPSFFDRAKVISGSADGFLRVCDLNSRLVAAPYQWNAHVSNAAVRGVAGFAQRTENELILLRDDLTLSTFDLR